MKYIAFALICVTAFALISFHPAPIDAGALTGAWTYSSSGSRTVMITTDKVFSVATYDVPGKKFISAYGGVWRLEQNKLVKKIEWNSADSTQVGQELTEDISLNSGKLLNKTRHETWSRLDSGKPGVLMGAWVITGNYRNDSVFKRASPFFPRRTMKVLSGKYFQWIAYNVTTRSFLNAGGGAYTTANGKYTETIEYFTKTPESIGKTMQFSYAFVNGDWRHKGQKSTGGDLDECWTKRDLLEN